MGRVRCAQGKYFLNTHSLGHLLSVDAVLWDVRCVLESQCQQLRRRRADLKAMTGIAKHGRRIMEHVFMELTGLRTARKRLQGKLTAGLTFRDAQIEYTDFILRQERLSSIKYAPQLKLGHSALYGTNASTRPLASQRSSDPVQCHH